jgi:hypothetical protein
MLDPDWLSKLPYQIFQFGTVISAILYVAYEIRRGVKKLWLRKPAK